MTNKYVSFIPDDHLLKCIGQLYDSYIKARNDISKSRFYSNKVDTIKMTFDAAFNEMGERELVQSEILRQIDKSINNSLGTFHENVLGGIEGYSVGSFSGFDIKADDDTLFADIKNKHNTMNSSSAEALFQKLARYANDYKNAKCYWVQILAKSSFNTLWRGNINGKEYSHSRVYKISGDLFYAQLSGQNDALFQLYKALPTAIQDYLRSRESDNTTVPSSALEEITTSTEQTNRAILDQITFENYSYYLGFDKL